MADKTKKKVWSLKDRTKDMEMAAASDRRVVPDYGRIPGKKIVKK